MKLRPGALWLCCPLALSILGSPTSRAADAPATDPARPAAISTEEVPTLPPEIFARLHQYQNMRAAQFLGWAPDGRGLLIATRFGNSSQLHRVYEPGGRREQLTFFEEPATGRFIPHAEDNAVLVSMSQGGSENFQISLLDHAGYHAEQLTDGKSRNELGPIRRDGSQMIVHSNRRNGRDTDLYVADCRLAHSMQMLLETKNEFWVAQDWSPDGKSLLVVREVSINESYPGLVDIAAKRLKPLPLPGKGKAAIGQMAFAPDGRTAYVTTDAEGEFLELMALDLQTQKYRPLARDIPWDATNLEVEPHSGLVAFAVNADGASELYLLEGTKRRRLEIPLGIVDHLDFSPDGKRLGFSLSRPDAPADAYSLDLVGGRVTRWTYSETGGIDPAGFVRPERIQFTSFDGRQIPAYIFRPRGTTAADPAPVLVSIHGGPESQYRPDFSPLVQYYVNELHLAMVYPNVRGSAGYGKTY
ncbi:MAG TPA: S9 family peptidase, partial [Pirellulales bacterium]|nr:S9 family peptidase [Pirellulales bacterium]